ncbi:unnamed protein product [Vicia faba]|uniref:Uncharacterized protein n=1 Tax=Vicia faba TaxID=3906 RepID=A0AAV0ZDV1_VICFA|nr:unnamed protein product [Vicia faba]
MEYLEDNKMSRNNRYSANLKKTENRWNWNHKATSERITLQGSSLLRRKVFKSNLLIPIDHWHDTKCTTLQKSAQIKITEIKLNWKCWGVTKLSTTRNASLHNQHLMTILKENMFIMQG